MRVVLIENFRAVFYAPFYAACALGAYDAERLEVELKPAAELGKALQAVSAGAGQVSWGGPLRILAALDQDPKCGYAAFCEVVGRDPFFLVGRTPNPGFAPAQLPQWTLAAVTEVPTPWICLQHDLRRAGIAPSAVKLARGRTMAENAAALRAGEADVIQVFQPHAQSLVDEGAVKKGTHTFSNRDSLIALLAVRKMCASLIRPTTRPNRGDIPRLIGSVASPRLGNYAASFNGSTFGRRFLDACQRS